ncbi:MAG: RdgB/HAM1 family non-canonical purine NTP pyrophosphatase [Candidatus Kapaibacterium sp.]
MKLLLATNNEHKREEMEAILKQVIPDAEVVSIADVYPEGIDVEETGETLEENAYLKAKTLYDITGLPTIADDTGLEVDALNGQPGVRTARFAGENATYQDNVNLTLEKLHGVPVVERSAKFRTVICFCSDMRTIFAEGVCEGRIAEAASGTAGFGYDPIFLPTDSTRTFAEMESGEKHELSHRGRALREFATLLEQYNQ